jgi:phosphatidylethanolamine-binding protein (PEBP) family uncharacterized protein
MRRIIITITAYLACVIWDICFLVKWNRYGEAENALFVFVLLMLLHLALLILAIKLFVQRKSLKIPLLGIIIIVLIVVASDAVANSMVEYVYNSKNRRVDMTLDDFKTNAKMKVTSDDLKNGVWDNSITNTSKGQNMSPHLSFDKVEGASYYVIYMVDESANNWVHWYAEVSDTTLNHGANSGDYIGPYPPMGSGDHTYTVYVYALSDKPGRVYTGKYPEFNEPWFSGDILWSDLNIKDGSTQPILYGNVISYGYIQGVYSR